MMRNIFKLLARSKAHRVCFVLCLGSLARPSVLDTALCLKRVAFRFRTARLSVLDVRESRDSLSWKNKRVA